MSLHPAFPPARNIQFNHRHFARPKSWRLNAIMRALMLATCSTLVMPLKAADVAPPVAPHMSIADIKSKKFAPVVHVVSQDSSLNVGAAALSAQSLSLLDNPHAVAPAYESYRLQSTPSLTKSTVRLSVPRDSGQGLDPNATLILGGYSSSGQSVQDNYIAFEDRGQTGYRAIAGLAGSANLLPAQSIHLPKQWPMTNEVTNIGPLRTQRNTLETGAHVSLGESLAAGLSDYSYMGHQDTRVSDHDNHSIYKSLSRAKMVEFVDSSKIDSESIEAAKNTLRIGAYNHTPQGAALLVGAQTSMFLVSKDFEAQTATPESFVSAAVKTLNNEGNRVELGAFSTIKGAAIGGLSRVNLTAGNITATQPIKSAAAGVSLRDIEIRNHHNAVIVVSDDKNTDAASTRRTEVIAGYDNRSKDVLIGGAVDVHAESGLLLPKEDKTSRVLQAETHHDAGLILKSMNVDVHHNQVQTSAISKTTGTLTGGKISARLIVGRDETREPQRSGSKTAQKKSSTADRMHVHLSDVALQAESNSVQLRAGASHEGDIVGGSTSLSLKSKLQNSPSPVVPTVRNLDWQLKNTRISASHNEVVLAGAPQAGNVYGGKISIVFDQYQQFQRETRALNKDIQDLKLRATHNKIVIDQAAQLQDHSVSLYGGIIKDQTARAVLGARWEKHPAIERDVVTGNTLDVAAPTVRVHTLANFEHYRFVIDPAQANRSDAQLQAKHIYLGNSHDILNGDATTAIASSVKVIGIHPGKVLRPNDKFVLMRASEQLHGDIQAPDDESNLILHRDTLPKGISYYYTIQTELNRAQKTVIAKVLGNKDSTKLTQSEIDLLAKRKLREQIKSEHQDQVKRLQEALQSRESQVQRQQFDLHAATLKAEQLGAGLAALQDELKRSQAALQETEGKSAQELAALREQVKVQEQALASKAQELEAQGQQVKALNGKVGLLKLQKQDISAQLAALQQQQDALGKAKQQLSERVAAYEQSLNEGAKANQELQDRMDKLKATHQLELQRLQKTLQSRSADMQRKERDLQDATFKAEQLSSSLATLQEEYKASQAALKAMQGESGQALAALREQVKAQEDALASKTQDLEAQSKMVNALNGTVSLLKLQKKEISAQLAALQQQQDALGKEKQQLSERVAAHEQSLNDSSTANRDLQAGIAKLKAAHELELQRLQKVLQSRDVEVQRQQSDLKAAKTEAQTLSRSLEQLKSELQAAEKALQERQGQSAHELDHLQNRYDNLQRDVQSKTQQMAEQSERINGLQAQLEHFQKAQPGLAADLAASQQKLMALGKEHDALTQTWQASQKDAQLKQNALQQLETQIAQLKSERLAQEAQRQGRIQAYENEVKQQKLALDAAKQQAQDLNEQLNKAQREWDSAQQALKALQSTSAQDKQALIDRRDALQSEVNDKAAKVLAQAQTIKDLQLQVAQLQANQEGLVHERAAQDERLKALSLTHQSLGETAQQSAHAVVEGQSKIKALQDKMVALEQEHLGELKRHQDKLRQSEADIQQQQQQLVQAKVNAQNLNEQLSQSQAKLQAVQQTLQETQAHSATELVALSQVRDALQAEIADKAQALTVQHKAIEQQNLDLVQAQQTAQALQEEVAQQRQVIEAQQSDLDDVQAQRLVLLAQQEALETMNQELLELQEVAAQSPDSVQDEPDAATVNPQLQALSDGQLTGLMLVTRAGDVASLSLQETIRSQSPLDGIYPFVKTSAAINQYGVHADASRQTHDMLLMAGVSGKRHGAMGAVFIEGGWSDFESHWRFEEHPKVDAQGHHSVVGVGLYGRLENETTSGPYVEGSLRLGRLNSQWTSDDLHHLASGAAASYSLQRPYYSAHAGLGYVVALSPNSRLDVSAHYLWSAVNGQNVDVLDEPIQFGRIQSQRLRWRATWHQQFAKDLSLQLGLGYEYEWDAQAHATTHLTDPIATTSMRGGTAMLNVGAIYHPTGQANLSLQFDLGVYAGQRTGAHADVQVKYTF